MFVLTDGYGTEGAALAKALYRASLMGVAVTAISVGREQCGVGSVYPSFLQTARP